MKKLYRIRFVFCLICGFSLMLAVGENALCAQNNEVTQDTAGELEIEKLASSSNGWKWEVQHYHLKVRLDEFQIVSYLQKALKECPSGKPFIKTEQDQREWEWKDSNDWIKWRAKIIHAQDLMQMTPSKHYLPELKHLIEKQLVPDGASIRGIESVNRIRETAVFTYGVIGGDINYLYGLLDSNDDYVQAGAIKAITYQLSLAKSSKPLKRFWEQLHQRGKGFDKGTFQFAVQGHLGEVLAIKEELEQPSSYVKKLTYVFDQIYLSHSDNLIAEISQETFSSTYAVREFYRLYQENRPLAIQTLTAYLKQQSDLSDRIYTLEKLRLLGVLLTQQETKELATYRSLPEWSPLTLPGVPIYNPDAYKRK